MHRWKSSRLLFSLFLLCGHPALWGQDDQATKLFENGLALYRQADFPAAMDHFSRALLYRPHDRQIQYYVIQTGQKIVDQEMQEKQMPVAELRKIIETAETVLEQRRTEMRQTLEQLKLAYAKSQREDSLLESCHGVDMLMDISLGDDPESSEMKQYLHSLCSNLKKSMDSGWAARSEDIHRILGYIAFCQSLWPEAIKEWNQALALRPDDRHLKNILRRAEDNHKKEQLGIELNRELAEGNGALKAGLNQKAAALAESVLKSDPANAPARLLLEKAQSKMQEKFRQELLLKNRRLALQHQGKEMWIEAAQNWLSVLEIDPLDSDARKNLAKIKDGLFNKLLNLTGPSAELSTDTAAVDEQKAKQYYTLGLVQYSQGNLEKAAQNFKNCLKINPRDLLARKALSRVETEIKYNPPQSP